MRSEALNWSVVGSDNVKLGIVIAPCDEQHLPQLLERFQSLNGVTKVEIETPPLSDPPTVITDRPNPHLPTDASGPEASPVLGFRRVCISIYGPTQAPHFSRTAGRLHRLCPSLATWRPGQFLSCRPSAHRITGRARAIYGSERGAMHKHGVRIQDPGD